MLMKERLHALVFSVALLASVPFVAVASGVDAFALWQAESEVSVTVSGQTVSVTGGQGETLEVVSLTGRVLKRIAIESNSQRVELNVPKGCYILKVGKTARKVSVQ